MNLLPENWRSLRVEPRLDLPQYRAWLTRTFRCMRCLALHTEPHHYIWKGRGGNWASCLLCIPLCPKCHRFVHDHEEEFNAEFPPEKVNESIVFYLKEWFHVKGWTWRQWLGLLSLEEFVDEHLEKAL